MAKKKFTSKAVNEVRIGDVVHPTKSWEAFTASCQTQITLDTNTGYRVKSQLEGVWLALEPKPGMSTTVIYVKFSNPDEQVTIRTA